MSTAMASAASVVMPRIPDMNDLANCWVPVPVPAQILKTLLLPTVPELFIQIFDDSAPVKEIPALLPRALLFDPDKIFCKQPSPNAELLLPDIFNWPLT